MNQFEHRPALTRAWLENYVTEFKEPNWYNWLGLYTRKPSVDAAKALLEAMDNNVVVTQEEALEVFVK